MTVGTNSSSQNKNSKHPINPLEHFQNTYEENLHTREMFSSIYLSDSLADRSVSARFIFFPNSDGRRGININNKGGFAFKITERRQNVLTTPNLT